ncbi:MAG: hypothetical protein IPJ58_09560 [Ardenticatenia bacterium]|nr:hypothetical protein [Ardenticatenia bacterium]
MAAKRSAVEVAAQLRLDLMTSGRDSRRMRSRNFWSAFGVERRTQASIERVEAALTELGLAVRSPGDALGTEEREDWIFVGLTSPELVLQSDAIEPPGKATLTPTTTPAAKRNMAWSATATPAHPVAPQAAQSVPAMPSRSTPAASRIPPSTVSLLDQLVSFARRHPILSLLIILIVRAKPWPFLILGAAAWLWSLYRRDRLHRLTRFAGQHKTGTLLTGGLATRLGPGHCGHHGSTAARLAIAAVGRSVKGDDSA